MDLTPFHGPPADPPQVPGFAARTLLGFGAHGEVWLADDLSTGGRVALKIGRRAADPGSVVGTGGSVVGTGPSGAAGLPSRPAAEHETALLCRIDHPHIVRLQRVVPLAGGGLALVLDLAAGGSLASLVAARGRFDPGEVSTLLVPLASALDHLHRRGVVHGDIAPGNVLFAADGRPQLGDLGVARVLGTRTDETYATPGFVDPALTGAGAHPVDVRAADVWGLAAVGWFALTGRPPGTQVGLSPVERAPVLGELLERCLTAEPDRRPTLAELADQAWQAAHPIPVRLIDPRDPDPGTSGLPPLSRQVTRRVPATAADGAGPAAGHGSDRSAPAVLATDGSVTAAARRRDPHSAELRAGRRSSAPTRLTVHLTDRIAGTGGRHRLAAAATVTGTGVAVAVISIVVARPQAQPEARPSAENARPATASSVVSPAGSRSVASGTAPATATVAAGAALQAEISRALGDIGRSRAKAFELASARYLAGADVSGSPAYQDDLELVQRLRAQGYRLHGVRYDISQVRVVHRSGELVDVRAVVTTSGHERVRAWSEAGERVPPDGPRALVFSLAPVDRDLTGPGRWRVRDVRLAA